MNHPQDDGREADVMRRAILEAARTPASVEAATGCARELQAGGVTAPARLMLLAVFVRIGFSPRARRRQAELAQATGLEVDPSPSPSLAPASGSSLDAAVAQLRALFDAEEAPSGRRAVGSPVSAPLSPPPADVGAVAEVVEPLAQLCAALGAEPSREASEVISRALAALEPLVLDRAAYDIEDDETSNADLAWRAAFNATRASLLAVYELARPPFGSPGVLHRLAQADEAGFGPYATAIETLVVNGGGLLGLLQLSRGRPPDGRGEREALGRWAWVLSRTAETGFRIDVVNALADLALRAPLWGLLLEAERQPDARPGRGLLQAARDAAMDLGAQELAWRLQEQLAAGWAGEKGEWLALGDLAAAHGDQARAEAAFEEAVRLDPEEVYGRGALEDLRAGRRERFGPRAGFGTPPERSRLRAERAAGQWREPPDYTREINTLQREAAFGELAWEVAPADPPMSPPPPREGLHLVHLGRRRRTRWGELPVLRGVQAVRGFYVSNTPVREVAVRLASQTLVRCTPVQHQASGDQGGRRKAVFNAWFDVSSLPPGRHHVEIGVRLEDGREATHHEHVVVEPAWREADHPSSDAVVDAPAETGPELDAAINARPSQRRPARRSYFEQPPRRVLVVRIDQLGDMVCSIPALQRLRALLPQAQLTGLVSPANAALARTLGLFDEVLTASFDVDPVEGRRVMPLKRQAELRKALHARDFDLAIDLADNSPSRFLLLLSGAKRLCGVEGKRYGFLDLPFQAHAFDAANGSEALPATNKMVALVEWLGCALQDYGTTLRRPDLDPALLQRFKVEPRRFAVLHTGARLAFSRWPQYPALARRLLEETELTVVLLADGLPAGTRFSPELTAHPRFRLVEHTVGFDELDALVSFCAVFVGNDSGPKHLASLRGAEVVSLHCARNNWNEWGQENRGVILSRRVPCAGCQISEHPEECGRDIACLKLISPDEVLAATLERLAASA